MMPHQSVRVVKVEQLPLLVVGQAPIESMRVTYMVGEQGPFFWTARVADYSMERFCLDTAPFVETTLALLSGATER